MSKPRLRSNCTKTPPKQQKTGINSAGNLFFPVHKIPSNPARFVLTCSLETSRPVDEKVDGFHPAAGSQLLEVICCHSGYHQRDFRIRAKKRRRSNQEELSPSFFFIDVLATSVVLRELLSERRGHAHTRIRMHTHRQYRPDITWCVSVADCRVNHSLGWLGEGGASRRTRRRRRRREGVMHCSRGMDKGSEEEREV